MAGKKKSNLKISLKMKKANSAISMYHSSRTKRIFAIIKREIFSGAYVKVSYGKHLDLWDKISEFYNDGAYQTKESLIFALKAFTEKDLADYINS